MHDDDLPAFAQRLDAVNVLLSRGKYASDATATAVFFRALKPYPLGAVLAGFDAHVCDPDRGRFPPLPADLLAQLRRVEARDGRPGPEEAWATAFLAATDKRTSVLWTAEIRSALRVAGPLLAAQDKVAARLAFIGAYHNEVLAARESGVAVAWELTLGTDPEDRRRVAAEAIAQGLPLAHPQRVAEIAQLPLPRGQLPLLANPEELVDMPEEIREVLRGLRAWLTAARSTEQSPDAAAREATRQAKAEAQRQVDEHLKAEAQERGRHGMMFPASDNAAVGDMPPLDPWVTSVQLPQAPPAGWGQVGSTPVDFDKASQLGRS